jgi:CPA1 family monovalent cation:H+ antiporter
MTALEQFDSIYNILILVTFVTLITWRLKFPSTLALIIAGILATVSTRLVIPEIGSEIFVTLLLPPILFQEALHLNVDDFIKESDSIILFATIGTVLMQISVGFFSYFILKFNLIESLLFGILIAPTDPVAVIRQFQSSNVDQRFQMIISGESLLNDGVSIVIYSLLLTILNSGSITPVIGLRLAIQIILGGLIIGVLVGYLVHSMFCWTNDSYAQVLISFMVAFGVYRVAEELGASGVLAIVVSGLIINYRSRKFGGLGRETYEMLENLWEFIGFLSSSFAFIFIGMNLDRQIFTNNFSTSLVVFLVLILFRQIMVELVSWLMQLFWSKGYSRFWKNGFSWAGLRGAVSIVLALGVSGVVPNSELIIAVTFGIVILSNFVQGTSINLLINDWGLISESEHKELFDNTFSEEYVSIGYNPSRSKFERMFFSAPEFFVKDTGFGSWISTKLISMIEYLNNYALDAIPSKTVSVVSNFVTFLTSILVGSLAWINQFVLRWDPSEEDKTKAGKKR